MKIDNDIAVITLIVGTMAAGCGVVIYTGVHENRINKSYKAAHASDTCLYEKHFKECMQSLPKGPESTQYNDWDEVVDSCRISAWSIAANLPIDRVPPECRKDW